MMLFKKIIIFLIAGIVLFSSHPAQARRVRSSTSGNGLLDKFGIDEASSFEAVLEVTQYELQRFLGPGLRIEVTDQIEDKAALNTSMFDFWVEFIEKSVLDSRDLTRIVLTSWRNDQISITLDEKRIPILGRDGVVLFDQKTVIINVNGKMDPCFVGIRNFAEIVAKKFTIEEVYNRGYDLLEEQQELVIDILAASLLTDVDEKIGFEYRDRTIIKYLSHITYEEIIKVAATVVIQIYNNVRFNQLKHPIGTAKELQVIDGIPKAALKDVPPEQRPPDYFQLGNYVVYLPLDARIQNILGGAAAVKAIVRDIAVINISNKTQTIVWVQILSDTGLGRNFYFMLPVTKNCLWKWDNKVAPFIPQGYTLRESIPIEELSLPERIIYQLEHFGGIFDLELLERVYQEGMLLYIPGITREDTYIIAQVLSIYRSQEGH